MPARILDSFIVFEQEARIGLERLTSPQVKYQQQKREQIILQSPGKPIDLRNRALHVQVVMSTLKI